MADELKIERYIPRPIDARFWADLAYTLISEIKCECGFINKVQPEWHTGFFKAECGECFEELDLQGILHVPDRTKQLAEMVDDDSEKKEKAKKQVDFVGAIPAPMQAELDKYVKELEARREKQKREAEKNRRKTDGWANSDSKWSDTPHNKNWVKIEWSDELGKYIRTKEDGSFEIHE